MALKKINVEKIDPQTGFDTFELLRNGAALDEQKVSAVIHDLVATVNELVEINMILMNKFIEKQPKIKLTQKRG